MRAQNKRGGRVKLHALVGTQSEFDHSEKGDALYAFELALCAPARSAAPGPRAALGWVVVPVPTCGLRGGQGRGGVFQLVEGLVPPCRKCGGVCALVAGGAQTYQLWRTHC